MTCRELVIYILENHLEDEPILNDAGTIVGFTSIDEAAVELGVGIPTIYALISQSDLDYIVIGGTPFVTIASLKKRKDNKA